MILDPGARVTKLAITVTTPLAEITLYLPDLIEMIERANLPGSGEAGLGAET